MSAQKFLHGLSYATEYEPSRHTLIANLFNKVDKLRSLLIAGDSIEFIAHDRSRLAQAIAKHTGLPGGIKGFV